MKINEDQTQLEKITAASYDVIIVGAGPAGCGAAYFLNESGFNVLLLEKHTMPREKVCGDGLSPKSLLQFAKMGVLSKIESANPFYAHSLILSSPNNKIMTGKTPKVDGLKDYFAILPRKKTDEILFNHVDALPNVTTLQNFRVTDIIRDGKSIIGVKGRGHDATYDIHGKYIIGADGPNSVIARRISLMNRNKKHLAFAARAYFEGVEGIEDAIEIHYEKKILPGYGWLFPTGENTANVGAGYLCRYMDTTSLKTLFHKFISENDYVKHKLRNARMIGELKGAPLTILTSPLKRSCGNVLLTGDAGSFVDALSGEGIYNALRTGELAARAINDVHHSGLTPDKNFERYIRKEFYFRERIPSKLIQPAMANASIVNWAVGLGSRDEKIAASLAGLIVHVVPKLQLLTKLHKVFLRMIIKR